MKEIISKNFKSYIESAFTLAETLIVIGIIGVVAALTLPNLNHATGDKEKVTKVMKIYSSLTDAIDRAQAVYGDYDTWFTDINFQGESDSSKANERFAKRIIEFMKVSKDCGFDEGCFSDAPLLSMNSRSWKNYLTELKSQHSYMVMLPDGISVGFNGCNWPTWNAQSGSSDDTGDCRIRVDIDGPNKGKNQEGNDLFYFNICKTGIACGQLQPEGNYVSTGNNPTVSNQNFTAWVIDHGNLDYLKCMDELDWETQTSCK